MAKKSLSTVGIEWEEPEHDGEVVDLPTLIHHLGNSLVPIVVHSELGLSLCEDERIRSHFKKIHSAAQQARKFMSALREHEMGSSLRSSGSS